jgi:RNA polymerase sigma factor (sigma-70 family)
MTENSEVTRLALLLEHSRGSIAFATFAEVSSRTRREKELRTALASRVTTKAINIDPSTPTWLSKLLRRLESSGDAVTIVRGLHNITAEQAQELNFHRERFARFSRGILFWIAPGDAEMFAQHARDFWAWRSGVFEFDTSTPKQLPYLVRRLRWQVRGDELHEERDLYDLERALREELDQPDPNWQELANLSLALGSSHLRIGQPRQAHGFLIDALRIAEDHPFALDDISLALSHVFSGEATSGLADYETARRELLIGTEMMNSQTNLTVEQTQILLRALLELAELLEEVSSHAETERTFHLAEQCAARISSVFPAIVYNKHASLLIRQDRLVEARDLLNRALMEAESANEIKAVILNNLGMLEAREGHYARAIERLTNSLAIKQELFDFPSQAQTLSNLALVSRLAGENEKSLMYTRLSAERLTTSNENEHARDAALVNSLLAGDSVAVEAVLRRIRHSVRRRESSTSGGLLAAPRDDRVYTAFAHLWKRLLDDPSRALDREVFYAVNQALEESERTLRRARQHTSLEIAEELSHGEYDNEIELFDLRDESELEIAEIEVDIDRALASMSTKARRAVFLSYVSELPISAVARATRLDEKEVTALLQEARPLLRKWFSDRRA